MLELRLSTASQETFEQVTAGTRWHNKWPRSSRDEHNSPAPSLLPILATKAARLVRWRKGAVTGARARQTETPCPRVRAAESHGRAEGRQGHGYALGPWVMGRPYG